MGNKPARMYTKVTGAANVRKRYMGGIPGSKITIFDMGSGADIF
jgi:large subunit ribosomal protein L10e